MFSSLRHRSKDLRWEIRPFLAFEFTPQPSSSTMIHIVFKMPIPIALKQTIQLLQQINVKKVHLIFGAGIRTHYLLS